MMQRFRTKMGWELIIPIACIFGIILYPAYRDGAWVVIAIQLIGFVSIGLVFYQTWYIIEGDELHIRVLFFRYPRIKIHDIRSVKKSKNPISAPAASLDRLAIRHGKMGFQLISPKDKVGFMRALLAINLPPRAVVEEILVRPG